MNMPPKGPKWPVESATAGEMVDAMAKGGRSVRRETQGFKGRMRVDKLDNRRT